MSYCPKPEEKVWLEFGNFVNTGITCSVNEHEEHKYFKNYVNSCFIQYIACIRFHKQEIFLYTSTHY